MEGHAYVASVDIQADRISSDLAGEDDSGAPRYLTRPSILNGRPRNPLVGSPLSVLRSGTHWFILYPDGHGKLLLEHFTNWRIAFLANMMYNNLAVGHFPRVARTTPEVA